ncbi:MAG TPA: hypothetical protein VFC63_17800 [Blastocatellia bacterium]|nr:hypothetical protein [Blastocatellia bacterium]
MKIKYCLAIALLLLVCAQVNAQSDDKGISTGYAVLTKAVELKNATVGQEVNLRVMADIAVDGKVVISKDASLIGHISAVTQKGNGAAESQLSIVIDKVVQKDGSEKPVQGIIGAVAAARDGITTENMPKLAGGSSNPNGLSSSNAEGSQGGLNHTSNSADLGVKAKISGLLLNSNSRGAIGFDGVSMSWQLKSPPPETIFSTKGKNIKLDRGTQMMLRMFLSAS